MTTWLAHRDPFGRHTPMVLDFEFVWHGRWAWWPWVNFSRVPKDNPISDIWRWQLFIGPLEIRRWQPEGAKPEETNRGT